MENVLYYTLSTIAQALAGTLAILVAVALASTSRITDAIQGGATHPRHRDATVFRVRIQQAVGLSLAVIALSFAALPFTRTIASVGYVAGVVLTIVVVLGIACLLLYWRLILTLTKFFD
jgi:lipopolysaccharide export LptBFGC system permease protein LptF